MLKTISRTGAVLAVLAWQSALAAPGVLLTAPAPGASYVGPASIDLAAEASGIDGGIAKVQFYHGGYLIGSATAAPYRFAWSHVAPGNYSIRARVVSKTGVALTSQDTRVSVDNPITVTLTSAPANDGTLPAPANLVLQAQASDSTGTIVKVQFYAGNILLGSASQAPYRFTWNNVAAGRYTLRARATDNHGITRDSARSTLVVNNAPTVALLAPLANARYTAPAAIGMTAQAADRDGPVSKVQFLRDGQLLATLNRPPYSFVWNNAPAGAHVLSARAFDSLGMSTTSAAVPVSVQGNVAPTLSLTATPANAPAPATITLDAHTTDGDGSIAKVEFFQGGTLLASVTQAPYRFSWTNVGAGSYSLTAKATDKRGASGLSTPVTVTVAGSAVKPVKVFLLAGQSNMVGFGGANADLNMIAPGLIGARSDVFARNIIEPQAALGALKPGYGSNSDNFGPELKFGHVMGDVFGEDVYLFKAAKGGTTLHNPQLWLPPSRGGAAGNLYAQMIGGFRDFLKNEFADRGIAYEVAGFVWFQGENDAAEGYQDSYAGNLRALLGAVRSDLALPLLPSVIVQINDTWGREGAVVMAAQQAVAAEDSKNALVYTGDQRPFYHYGSYSMVAIGERMAQSMLRLMGQPMALHLAYTVAPQGSLAVATAKGVLAAGSWGSGSATQAILVNDVEHGTLVLRNDGGFDYTPAPGFVGRDGFDFQLMGKAGASNTARATLWVRDESDALVLHYTFDQADVNAFVDRASGLAAHVQTEGVTSVSGKIGRAAHFDGLGVLDYMYQYPAHSFLALNSATDFSIASWIKTDAKLSGSQLISRNGNYTYAPPWGYLFATGDNGIGIKAVVRAQGGAGVALSSTGGVVDDGMWHHVAVSFGFSIGKMTLYVDGNVVGQADISGVQGDLVAFESVIGAGTENYAPDQNTPGLQGSLDDFRLYRKALSVTEVQALMR